MSSAEVKRFPLGASKAAPKTAESLRGRRGERGPPGPPGPAGETKVVYVEKDSGASRAAMRPDTSAQSSLVKASVSKNATVVNTVAGVRTGAAVVTQYTISITPESHTDQGNAYTSVEICHPTDLAGQRHIQVYERICPPDFTAKCGLRRCPCNCLENIIGCIVSTKCPTCFGPAPANATTDVTLNKIVGAVSFTDYDAAQKVLAAAALPTILPTFCGLQAVDLTYGTNNPTAAELCAEAAGANSFPAGVVKNLTAAMVNANYTAWIAGTAPFAVAAGETEAYVIVHLDDGLKASQRRSKFSWYLATIVNDPAAATATITPVSLCSYPDDTVWATLRDRGTCVELPTRQTVDPDTTLYPTSATNLPCSQNRRDIDGNPLPAGVSIGEKTPQYWTVPGYKYPEDSTKNVNGKWTLGDPNSTADQGYVPQGSASHPIGLVYCIREKCTPSMLCLRAGLPDGQGNVKHNIWGFRLMYLDEEDKVFKRLVPAVHTYQQGADEGAWATTVESDAANGQYCIKTAELCIPIDAQESADDDDALVPVCTNVSSDRWQLELILCPTRSKAKFTITDLKLLGFFGLEGTDCPTDNAEWWKVEPHPRNVLTDLTPDAREISIVQIGHNRSKIYFAATSFDKVFKINVQTPSEIRIGGTPPTAPVDGAVVINDELMDAVDPTTADSDGNVLLRDDYVGPLRSGPDGTGPPTAETQDRLDVLSTVYENGLGLPHTGICTPGGIGHSSSGINVHPSLGSDVLFQA